MTPVKVIVCGSKGRMGQTLVACAKSDPELNLVGEIDLGDDLARIIGGCDVVLDFSSHEATGTIGKVAADHKKALVIGTTGHTDLERQAVQRTVKPIPCVWASNFSTGVNVLFWLAGKTAGVVG